MCVEECQFESGDKIVPAVQTGLYQRYTTSQHSFLQRSNTDIYILGPLRNSSAGRQHAEGAGRSMLLERVPGEITVCGERCVYCIPCGHCQ